MENNKTAVQLEPWLLFAMQSKKDISPLLKEKALADERIKGYLQDIRDFHSTLVTNHKNPELPIHKLHFLLDIGLSNDTPEIAEAIEQILSHKDDKGVYQSLTNIPKHFGGTGTDIFGWCLCDAPLLLAALIKCNVDYKTKIKAGVEHLLSLCRENGFPCSVSSEFGKFHGPGRKDDPCPYATLQMLKMLALIPEHHETTSVKVSVDALLSLWECSLDRHPYQYYMGTDFRKLKAPLIWYDIVSVADCLSQFSYARKDQRFLDMLSIIKDKRGVNDMFIPEAVFLKYKAWDFGQKKNPSPYLTFICNRIIQRCEGLRLQDSKT